MSPYELSTGKLPLLGLVCICKNEARHITAVLKTYKPYIDRFTVLDTGSSDGTQDLVRKALADIPGTLYEEPFIDFATSRNRALELHGRATVFTIMPNADLLIGGDALRMFLEAHCDAPAKSYMVVIEPGNYKLPLVLRAAGGWRYRWPTHELAIGDTPGCAIPGVTIMRDRTTRTAEQWRARWLRDLELLRAEIDKNPADDRSWFYLGRTHECLGDFAAALDAYIIRAALPGYFDERVEAKMSIARMLTALERPWPEIHAAYLNAHAFDPRRAEPLYQIAWHYHKLDSHALAYLFARRAAELVLPDIDMFGVDAEVYTWKAADLCAIHAFYVPGADTRKVGKACADRVVAARPFDEHARSNRAFYAPSALELFGDYQHRPIRVDSDWPPAPFVITNPSIHYDGQVWRCIIRTVDYRLVDGKYFAPGGHPITVEHPIHTRNWMAELTDDLEIAGIREMTDQTTNPRTNFPVHGFEDCRLFEHGGKLWAVASARDLTEHGTPEQVLLDLGADYAIQRCTPLRGSWSAHCQKNWMPFEKSSDGMMFVYSTDPVAMLRYQPDADTFEPCQLPSHPGRLRGSSQGVYLETHVGAGWLCIVHEVVHTDDLGGRIYMHRFVFLNQTQTLAMTEPFFFKKLGIEFCAGLACDGKKLVASFGVEDRTAYFGIFDLEAVRAALRSDYQI